MFAATVGVGMGESTDYPIHHLINNGDGKKPTGAVWGRPPPNRAEKNSPPLGVGVASNIPDAMIKRHGGGISDYALWPYRNKKRGASRHPFLLSMMGNSLGALTPGRTNGNHKASA